MAASSYRERLQLFQDILCRSDCVDMKRLRAAAFDAGIPDDHNYRSLAWKVCLPVCLSVRLCLLLIRSDKGHSLQLLLGYLGTDKSEWEQTLSKKRNLYKNFVTELILCDPLQNQKDDHPLNPAPNSQWNVYFKDNEILSQIFKDVRRLYPDISFFQQKIPKSLTRRGSCSADSFNETPPPKVSPTGVGAGHRMDFTSDCDIIGRPSYARAHCTDIIRNPFGGYMTREKMHCKNHCPADDDDGGGIVDTEIFSSLQDDEFHWQVLARILFIYAKLNPGQGYVQGMNEIIGPIYYVFSNDCRNELFTGFAEADTFWCFTELMSEIRDLYNSQLDADRSTGVVAMMTKLTNLLSSEDPELYHKLLHSQSIKPHYYAFRWITLLLSQEFPLPGTCLSVYPPPDHFLSPSILLSPSTVANANRSAAHLGLPVFRRSSL